MAGRRGATKPVAKKPVKKSPEKEPVSNAVEEQEPEKVLVCDETQQSEPIGEIVDQYERYTVRACRSYAKAVELVIGKIAVGSPVNQQQIQQIEAMGKHCGELASQISLFRFKPPYYGQQQSCTVVAEKKAKLAMESAHTSEIKATEE